MTAIDTITTEAEAPDRLAVLDSYGILDTPPEQGFDDIVHLARELCDAPVALVSLVAGKAAMVQGESRLPPLRDRPRRLRSARMRSSHPTCW